MIRYMSISSIDHGADGKPPKMAPFGRWGVAWASGLALSLAPVAVAASSEPMAVEGTDDNWNDVITSSPLVLVGFFAPCEYQLSALLRTCSHVFPIPGPNGARLLYLSYDKYCHCYMFILLSLPAPPRLSLSQGAPTARPSSRTGRKWRLGSTGPTTTRRRRPR